MQDYALVTSFVHMIRVFMAAGLILMASLTAANATNPVVVYDGKTGKVMVAKDAGKPWYPASLTKLMTAYIVFQAIEQGKITTKTKGTVTKTSSAPPPSKIGFRPGKKVSVDLALKALLIYSANDMATFLAEVVAGSQKKFAELMNATARDLGMTGSHFVNPHGLHNKDQYTTARDMAILSYALLNKYPQARKFYSAPYLKLGKRKLRNRNYLLRIWDKADGMKTGFICPAGFNLVATAKINGRLVVGVVFGTRSGRARAQKAKVVMETAASYPGSSSITALKNEGGTPPNMRKTVCGGKGLRMVNADKFSGWGATFGKFKSAAEAEAVINGIQAVKVNAFKRAGSGVVRIPFTKDFVPVTFNLSRSTSNTLCQQVSQAGGKCEVVTPSVFASFANLSGREKARGGKSSGKKKRRQKRRIPASDK